MADWTVKLYTVPSSGDAFGTYVGQYSTASLTWEINNSKPGTTTWELALGQSRYDNPLAAITQDQFAPQRTDFQLCRGNKVITAGMVTSVNLNNDRDTILCSGQDWIHYLERRTYPFDPDAFLNDPSSDQYYQNWPKKWVDVDLGDIVRDLLTAMKEAPSNGEIVGQLPIINPSGDTGSFTRYKIWPADETTIFDHINAIASISDTDIGFEFDILPLTLEFKLWAPRKDTNDGVPIWWFKIPGVDETEDSVIDFDWTNDGPAGTFLVGIGKKPAAQVWTDIQTVEKFRRLDLFYDYGTMTNTDLILSKLKDQNDLWPQKKLSMTVLNPEVLSPSLYSGAYPRGAIGSRIRVTRFFDPYHKVDAFFRINSLQSSVDPNGNESVVFGLEMVYDPDSSGGSSGGLPVRSL